jgi:cobaltochelatase CobT
MAEREPVAFLSYVRSDDAHDFGRISELRRSLEGEVKIQTGHAFHIFQDRNDISWGEQWKERIESALRGVTFLIPIVTPSYFQSPACRSEFHTFLIRERELGEERLILPIYYVSCDEMDSDLEAADEIATVLKARNWADWRGFRFTELTSPQLREQIASLAKGIKSTIKALEAVLAAAESTVSTAESAPQIRALPSNSPVPPYRPEVPAIRISPGMLFSEQIYNEVINHPYYAYTTAYDEVVTPSEMLQPTEAMDLHSKLLKYLRSEAAAAESEISRRSTTIEEESKNQDLAITFLIDNSGSMRGTKILGTACWISIISGILAQFNIPTEVAGFTTRAWKGGNSRELWIKDGKRARPGRLNDVRYIIYKSFEQTQQEADTNFGLMLREGLLKENIDGEALLWGYSRLVARSEKRKILIMISDGAPVDDSTLSVNPGNFLEAHCRATINRIRSEETIELYGVGIEFDVSRYYGAGSPTLSAQAIGPDLLIVIALAIEQNWKDAASIQRKSAPRQSAKSPRTPRRRRSKTTSPGLLTPSSLEGHT